MSLASPPAAETAAPAPPAQELPGGAEVAVRKAARPNRWFVPLVFVPLVFYALGATFFVGWSILQVRAAQRQAEEARQQLESEREAIPRRVLDELKFNPFDRLPDDGDDAGVRRDGRRIGRHVTYPAEFASLPLPESRRVGLGQTLRVGALEVTPLRVERRRVRVCREGVAPRECRADSLVLHLRFRNASADQAFAPLDNYFDRWWSGGGATPLTRLEAGRDRLCGGPARWAPPDPGGRRRDTPQWVEGRQPADPDGLAPGATADGFVCTDGNDTAAVRLLFGEHAAGRRVADPSPGPFLWRVQLRRGLVAWRGRERSATTVIGVEFARDAFETAGPG
jgi:hypothetical protein